MHTGMNKSQLIKRMIAIHGSRVHWDKCINRSDAANAMRKRIEMNRKVMELLCKLERKRTFTGQFKTPQEYIEWSLEQADAWFKKYPYKEIKGYVDF